MEEKLIVDRTLLLDFFFHLDHSESFFPQIRDVCLCYLVDSSILKC
jgi:hypothetical protein